MGKMINAVLGVIDSAEMGVTLVHEHLSCADWSMRMNFGERFYEAGAVTGMAAGQLRKAASQGLKTLVDGTPVNLGRDINLMREASRASGVNVIASSGFYYQQEPWLEERDEEQIYELLKYECVNGISGTDSLPGIMKSGVAAAGLTPLIKKLISATARVAFETGLPVFCHHDPSVKTGGDILAAFAARGVPARRVILGHSGDTNNLGYLTEMLEAGCFLGFDRLGHCSRGNSLSSCVSNIIALAERGYLGRLLLSHDLASYLAFWESWEEAKASKWLELDEDFTFVFRRVLPALKAAGMTARDADSLLTENPRAFFEG